MYDNVGKIFVILTLKHLNFDDKQRCVVVCCSFQRSRRMWLSSFLCQNTKLKLSATFYINVLNFRICVRPVFVFLQKHLLYLIPNIFCSSLVQISSIPQLSLMGKYISGTCELFGFELSLLFVFISLFTIRLQEGLHQVVPSESPPQDSHG